MFCKYCGKQIFGESKFCPGCGNAVLPPVSQPVVQTALAQQKPRKPAKKQWIAIVCAALAFVAVMAMVATIAIDKLSSKTETVYVMTGYTLIQDDGTLLAEYSDFSYDEFGNPLQWQSIYPNFPCSAEYDDHGNLIFYSRPEFTAQYKHTYEYTYNDRDQITSCDQYVGGALVDTWEFTWNKKGLLTHIHSSSAYESGFCYSLEGYSVFYRGDFVYDSNGRLIREYLFISDHTLRAYEYRYNDNGNLTSIGYDIILDCGDYDVDLDDFSFDFQDLCKMTYDNEGKLTKIKYQNIFNGFMLNPDDAETAFQTVRLDYDRDGNLECNRGGEHHFDSAGNLVRVDSCPFPIFPSVYNEEFDAYIATYGTLKMEYEAIEMSQEAAQRYRRWCQLNHMDILFYDLDDHFSDLEYAHIGIESAFFYYLIPNPFW